MSAANEARLRLGKFLLASGIILMVISYLSDAVFFGVIKWFGIAFLLVGYSASYGNAIIPTWNRRALRHNARLPKRG